MNGRAKTQTHNCFPLKTDVFQKNRGGMDFSQEAGAAVNQEWALQPPRALGEICEAFTMGETCWYSLFLLHYF